MFSPFCGINPQFLCAVDRRMFLVGAIPAPQLGLSVGRSQGDWWRKRFILGVNESARFLFVFTAARPVHAFRWLGQQAPPMLPVIRAAAVWMESRARWA